MIQVYRTEPYKTEHETVLDSIINEGDRTLVTCRENLFSVGGGQPADHGALVVDGETLRVEALIKHKGDLRLAVRPHEGLYKGARVVVRIDWPRRYLIMRLHTAQHTLAASARLAVRGEYEQRPMEISEDVDRCSMRFRSTEPITDRHIRIIEEIAEDAILRDIPITSMLYPSLASARAVHAPIFRNDPSLQFKGNVRTVLIEGLDANICGGTHCSSTKEVTSVAIEDFAYDDDIAECRLDFRLNG